MKRAIAVFLLIGLLLSGSCAGPSVLSSPTSTTGTPLPIPTARAATTPATKLLPEELKIHFIDVGQGDSILIDRGETEVLIDGGEKSPGVTDYLKKYVDGPLEVMVATHPHSDHIGGLPAVLNSFQVQQIWYNGERSDSKIYTEFMATVQAEGADVHIGKRGDKISVGQLTFTLLNPFSLGGTTNNNSIVMSLKYGEVAFLFTGDAEKEAETAMLLAGDIPVPAVDVLKVGHHGSRTASSRDFLNAAKPKVAVYMAGTGNSYGHPHQETIASLSQIGAKIYGTDVNGTIVVTTDGESFTVNTETPAKATNHLPAFTIIYISIIVITPSRRRAYLPI